MGGTGGEGPTICHNIQPPSKRSNALCNIPFPTLVSRLYIPTSSLVLLVLYLISYHNIQVTSSVSFLDKKSQTVSSGGHITHRPTTTPTHCSPHADTFLNPHPLLNGWDLNVSWDLIPGTLTSKQLNINNIYFQPVESKKTESKKIPFLAEELNQVPVESKPVLQSNDVIKPQVSDVTKPQHDVALDSQQKGVRRFFVESSKFMEKLFVI